MSSAIFVERFKELLMCAEKNENGLAQAAHLPLKSVLNWSRGITYPAAKSLFVLADYFHVTTDYLLGLDNYDTEKICQETLTVEKAQKTLAGYLNEYLQKEEIKRNRLARLLGTQQGVVVGWLEKGSMPETAMLIKISTLLDKPLDELLGRR